MTEIAFIGGSAICTYSDSIYTMLTKETESLSLAEAVARRVSNINPVVGLNRVEFQIDWHPAVKPLLDESILVRTFSTRKAAESFEVGIIADLLNMSSGRAALSEVCASEALA